MLSCCIPSITLHVEIFNYFVCQRSVHIPLVGWNTQKASLTGLFGTFWGPMTNAVVSAKNMHGHFTKYTGWEMPSWSFSVVGQVLFLVEGIDWCSCFTGTIPSVLTERQSALFIQADGCSAIVPKHLLVPTDIEPTVCIITVGAGRKRHMPQNQMSMKYVILRSRGTLSLHMHVIQPASS